MIENPLTCNVTISSISWVVSILSDIPLERSKMGWCTPVEWNNFWPIEVSAWDLIWLWSPFKTTSNPRASVSGMHVDQVVGVFGSLIWWVLEGGVQVSKNGRFASRLLEYASDGRVSGSNRRAMVDNTCSCCGRTSAIKYVVTKNEKVDFFGTSKRLKKYQIFATFCWITLRPLNGFALELFWVMHWKTVIEWVSFKFGRFSIGEVGRAKTVNILIRSFFKFGHAFWHPEASIHRVTSPKSLFDAPWAVLSIYETSAIEMFVVENLWLKKCDFSGLELGPQKGNIFDTFSRITFWLLQGHVLRFFYSMRWVTVIQHMQLYQVRLVTGKIGMSICVLGKIPRGVPHGYIRWSPGGPTHLLTLSLGSFDVFSHAFTRIRLWELKSEWLICYFRKCHFWPSDRRNFEHHCGHWTRGFDSLTGYKHMSRCTVRRAFKTCVVVL